MTADALTLLLIQCRSQIDHITDHIHFHMLSATSLAVAEIPVPVCLHWSFLRIMCVHCYHDLLIFLSSSCSFLLPFLWGLHSVISDFWDFVLLSFCGHPSKFRETGLASSLYLSLPAPALFFSSCFILFFKLNMKSNLTPFIFLKHLFSPIVDYSSVHITARKKQTLVFVIIPQNVITLLLCNAFSWRCRSKIQSAIR